MPESPLHAYECRIGRRTVTLDVFLRSAKGQIATAYQQFSTSSSSSFGSRPSRPHLGAVLARDCGFGRRDSQVQRDQVILLVVAHVLVGVTGGPQLPCFSPGMWRRGGRIWRV